MEATVKTQEVFVRILAPLLVHTEKQRDLTLRQACAQYCQLWSEPEYALYFPGKWLKKHLDAWCPLHHTLTVTHESEDRIGDTERLALCFQLLFHNLKHHGCTNLALTFHGIAEHGNIIPALSIRLEGAGKFPDVIRLHEKLALGFEDFNALWTTASSGGKITRDDDGWHLRLNGMRLPPEPLPIAGLTAAILGKGENLNACREALDRLLPEESPAPGNPAALLDDVLNGCETDLKRNAILIDRVWEANTPQVPLLRGKLRLAFEALAQFMLDHASPSAATTVISENAAAARELVLMLSIPLKGPLHGSSAEVEFYEFAVLAHGGAFSCEASEQELSLTCAFPDTVGRTLDAFLPGWERLSSQSGQMLRLLKSGAPAPPEDLILGGMLEHELESRLLPRLGHPLASHAARDCTAPGKALPGSHPDRLKKALGQVEKGKVKKEICQPQYAGELMWALRHGESQRYVATTEDMSDDELHELCMALLASPPAALTALQILARHPQG